MQAPFDEQQKNFLERYREMRLRFMKNKITYNENASSRRVRRYEQQKNEETSPSTKA